jgi:ferritin
MRDEIRAFLEESILLELNMSDLYRILSIKLPSDSEFLWNLSQEEVNHASMIRTINDVFLPEKILPQDSIIDQIESIRKSNKLIIQTIAQFRENTPSREEAFSFVYNLEKSAGEIHYQKMMSTKAETIVEKVFQKLNGEDKNHAGRIANYMKNNNILRFKVNIDTD